MGPNAELGIAYAAAVIAAAILGAIVSWIHKDHA